MTTPVANPPLNSGLMALPPADLPGVMICLSIRESELLLDWMMKSVGNLEKAIADQGNSADPTMYQMLSTLAIAIQSAHSAAAVSAIYDDPNRSDRQHFMHLNQYDAVTIIRMLQGTPSAIAKELHGNIIAQVTMRSPRERIRQYHLNPSRLCQSPVSSRPTGPHPLAPDG